MDTAMVTTRLVFPLEGTVDWRNNMHLRNKAAKCIDTELSRLYSQGFLSGGVACRKFRAHADLMRGDGHTFRLQLGSLLRDPSLKSTSDSPPNTVTNPSTCVPTVEAGETRRPMPMGSGEGSFLLHIREAAETTNIDGWIAGTSFDYLDTQLKETRSKGRATFKPAAFANVKRDIQESIDTESYRTNSARCVFGNVVVCGPDMESTDGSSSTAAAS